MLTTRHLFAAAVSTCESCGCFCRNAEQLTPTPLPVVGLFPFIGRSAREDALF